MRPLRSLPDLGLSVPVPATQAKAPMSASTGMGTLPTEGPSPLAPSPTCRPPPSSPLLSLLPQPPQPRSPLSSPLPLSRGAPACAPAPACAYLVSLGAWRATWVPLRAETGSGRGFPGPSHYSEIHSGPFPQPGRLGPSLTSPPLARREKGL